MCSSAVVAASAAAAAVKVILLTIKCKSKKSAIVGSFLIDMYSSSMAVRWHEEHTASHDDDDDRLTSFVLCVPNSALHRLTPLVPFN